MATKTKDDSVSLKFEVNSERWKVVEALRDATAYATESKASNRHPRNKLFGWLVDALFTASESTLEALAKDLEDANGEKLKALEAKGDPTKLGPKDKTTYNALKGQLDAVRGFTAARTASKTDSKADPSKLTDAQVKAEFEKRFGKN